MCKPPERCRIEASHRRFYHVQKEPHSGRKRATKENPGAAADGNIGSMDDIQNLFKETIAEFMENGLEAELDDELGYSRYDYRNKATDNSRNGHSSKTLRTSLECYHKS